MENTTTVESGQIDTAAQKPLGNSVLNEQCPETPNVDIPNPGEIEEAHEHNDESTWDSAIEERMETLLK